MAIASNIERQSQPCATPSVHHPFLASQCAGFVVKYHDAAASKPLKVQTHKIEVDPILEIMSIELSTHDIQNTIWNN